MYYSPPTRTRRSTDRSRRYKPLLPIHSPANLPRDLASCASPEGHLTLKWIGLATVARSVATVHRTFGKEYRRSSRSSYAKDEELGWSLGMPSNISFQRCSSTPPLSLSVSFQFFRIISRTLPLFPFIFVELYATSIFCGRSFISSHENRPYMRLL